MCPLANMVFNGSVENIFVYLDRHKPGSPLPEDLFEGLNPYQHRPSNLPVGIWHLVNLTEQKENDFGIWKVKEEALEIFTNSSLTGWRTTLHFSAYKDSLEHITNWVMHEYKIRLKDLSATNKEKPHDNRFSGLVGGESDNSSGPKNPESDDVDNSDKIAAAVAATDNAVASGNEQSENASDGCKPCSTLFIANLGPKCTEDELKQALSQYPGFNSLKIRARGGMPVSFADFEEVEHATAAMTALQGSELPSSDRGGMSIEYARSKMRKP